MMLYRFDKKLRLLLFNEIEKVEVAIRSAIVNIATSMIGDPFWMTDGGNFADSNRFARTMSLIDSELRHSREDFIIHFKTTYSNPYPPAWILSEILPFGVITNIYGNIKNKKIKKRISQAFGLQIDPFESWLTIITGQRNSCCHHSRVWNKQYSIRATHSKQNDTSMDNPANWYAKNLLHDVCHQVLPWHHIAKQRYAYKTSLAVRWLPGDRPCCDGIP